MATARPTSTRTVQLPAVPQLNVPPVAYDQNYQNQLNNVLRLYFEQLNNAVYASQQTASSAAVLVWLGIQ